MLAYNEIIGSSGVLRHAVYLHLLIILYHYVVLSHYNLLIQISMSIWREQYEAYIKNFNYQFDFNIPLKS